MARVPEVTSREELPPDQRQHYDSIVATRKRIAAPYTVLLHAPELAARIAHLIGYCRFESSLPANVKELAICTVAREMDCALEWAVHEEDAVRAGVGLQVLEALKNRRAQQDASGDESNVIRYVQDLLRPPHKTDSGTLDALRDRLGVAGLVELTGIVGAYAGLACCINAFEFEVPEGLPTLPH